MERLSPLCCGIQKIVGSGTQPIQVLSVPEDQFLKSKLQNFDDFWKYLQDRPNLPRLIDPKPIEEYFAKPEFRDESHVIRVTVYTDVTGNAWNVDDNDSNAASNILEDKSVLVEREDLEFDGSIGKDNQGGSGDDEEPAGEQ
jgi:hypothetical protein